MLKSVFLFFSNERLVFQKIGLALLILYLFQLTLGVIIHFFKTPSFMGGRRPPQNYVHAILGLVIIALAFYQVHYGIKTEWYEATFGDGTIVPDSALHAWIALIVVSSQSLFYYSPPFDNKYLRSYLSDFLGTLRNWTSAPPTTIRARSSSTEDRLGEIILSFSRTLTQNLNSCCTLT